MSNPPFFGRQSKALFRAGEIKEFLSERNKTLPNLPVGGFYFMSVDVSLFVKENNQRNFVQKFIEDITKATFVMCARVDTNDDYDEFTNVHTGDFTLESAINRNWSKFPYRTNGVKIETMLNGAWLELSNDNFFSIATSFLLTNHYDVCAPD